MVTSCGLEDMTAHFIPRRRYRGDGHWTWQIRRDDRQVTRQGNYILCINRHNFSNAGIREACISTDHRIVLAVIRGEGAHRNGAYLRKRICCPIKPRTLRPLTEGEAEFAELKGEVERVQRPTKAQAPWITQETWCLSDIRTALLITGRARSTEIIQTRQEFQRALQEYRFKKFQDAVTAIESLMETGKLQESHVRISRWYRQERGVQAP